MADKNLSLSAWAKKVKISVSLAGYYAKMQRIVRQSWNPHLQRWEIPVDSPRPDLEKRGPKVSA
jgi:hypothetical protein